MTCILLPQSHRDTENAEALTQGFSPYSPCLCGESKYTHNFVHPLSTLIGLIGLIGLLFPMMFIVLIVTILRRSKKIF